MKELTPEQVQKFKDLGWDDNRISSTAKQLGYKMPTTFMGRVKEDILTGAKNIGQGFQVAKQGFTSGVDQIKQGNTVEGIKDIYSSGTGGALKSAGGLVQAAASPFNSGVVSAARAVVPESVRTGTTEAIGGGFQALAGSKFGQEAMAQYQKLKQENPGLAAGLEGAGSLVMNVPALKAQSSIVKTAVNAGKNTLETVGSAMVRSGAAKEAAIQDSGILGLVGPATGTEAGAKATGRSAARQAARSEQPVIEQNWVQKLVGVSSSAADDATREQQGILGVFRGKLKGNESQDQALKVVNNTIDEIDNARRAPLAQTDAAMNKGQFLANRTYFTSSNGSFVKNLVKGTDDLTITDIDGGAAKMAETIVGMVRTNLANQGNKNVLQAVDKAVSDFIKTAKRQNPKAFENVPGVGKSAAAQAADIIRDNARKEIARVLNKELRDTYIKEAQREMWAYRGLEALTERVASGFGKSTTQAVLNKANIVMQGQGVVGATAFGLGLGFFPQFVGTVGAVGLAGALAYYGVSRPVVRKFLGKTIQEIGEQIPKTEGVAREELVQQLIIATTMLGATKAKKEAEKAENTEE